ncbi:50S ribosomal protein L6 [Candidatus Carsonella ruddii]|uniref:50S ribosomal protein L6 n=1 Tax=Candidatus Carsonella ruddii (Diaphorina cf. continua) TaxID=2661587 RepID=A0A7R6VYD7_CARRU|nr:50S ribosomal protein L6 [Candidatus Carsonella ruddii (Diaphorina cf. continua)]BCG49382.1 50S ribosomal protein L6 [Candidatus Carsonella ruddii (Diaphorina cf. continua)]
MKYINFNNEIILIKNKYLFLKKINFGEVKIPNNLIVYLEKNILFIKSINFEKKNEISFYKQILNIIYGTNKLWESEVLVSGIGYKLFLNNNKLFLNLGYSDTKSINVPNYITIELKKDRILIKSIYKDKMGNFIKKIIQIKRFDPYKKKGIYLKNNIVLKKSSKKKQ